MQNQQVVSRRRRAALPFAAMLLLVVGISALAYAGALPAFGQQRLPQFDRVMHLVLFGLLAASLDLWLGGRGVRLAGRELPLALVLVVSGAAVEELLQTLSPRRTADPVDLLCDVAGCALFIALHRWRRRRRRRHGT